MCVVIGEISAVREATVARNEQRSIVPLSSFLSANESLTIHKIVCSSIFNSISFYKCYESFKLADMLKEELGNEPATRIAGRLVYYFVKRLFYVIFSITVPVAFCRPFVVIKIDGPKGPVFFKQTRVGKNGRTFQMLRFRSMCIDAETGLAELRELNEKTGPVFKIADDPRIFRVGKWLRKLSLDELPQSINVLFLDMSTVGPRPALPVEVATYSDYQRQRPLVKLGLTCYWQTRRNRDSITFDEWVDLDLLYIKKFSVWSGFKLIIQTIDVVLTAQGN